MYAFASQLTEFIVAFSGIEEQSKDQKAFVTAAEPLVKYTVAYAPLVEDAAVLPTGFVCPLML